MELKPLKLMTCCPTRIANLLDCSTRTVKILFPSCDMLTTSGVKEEEASYFLSPMCLGILHIFSDLEGVFVCGFLRKLDKNDATIFEVFGLSENFIDSMNQFKSPQFDSFLLGLKEDENGNIM